jgi:hypothetical protein
MRQAGGWQHGRLDCICLAGLLIAVDNLFWWLASWIANDVFVKVTGDSDLIVSSLERELFNRAAIHPFRGL